MSKITAIYIRLSMEDEDVSLNRKEESNSVSSQRELLKTYIENHSKFKDTKVQEYCDEYNLRLIQFDTETAVKPHKITALGANRQPESRHFRFVGFDAHLSGCIVAPSGQGWVQFCTQA